MEEIVKCKSFKDNVHGYIEIPSIIVDKIIDTENFQRLRYIEQTGMRVLYPSARHDRFAHSIGVFYLGSLVSKYFTANIRKSKDKYKELNFLFLKKECEIRKNTLLFQLACLLHDVAHAPFSHSFENYYNKLDNESLMNNNLSMSDVFNKCFITDDNSADFKGYTLFTAHEMASAIIVKKVYEGAIKEILAEYFKDDCKQETITQDVEFVARMIVGCKYSSKDGAGYQIKNCFIELLNSKQFDVDKLDYVIRDSVMSGMDNTSIDVERLCKAVTLFKINEFDTKAKDCSIEETSLILSSKTNGKAEFAGNASGDIEIKNAELTATGKIKFKGRATALEALKIKSTSNSSLKINGSNLREDNDCLSANLENESEYDFEGECTSLRMKIKSAKITASNATIKIATYEDGMVNLDSCYFSGKVSGLANFEAVDNGGIINQKKSKYKVAFHKNALSIFQNLNLARNYEYLWIYSHHKVVYYANYLLQATFGAAVKLSEIKPWNIVSVWSLLPDSKNCTADKQKFRMVCDGDILSFIKSKYLEICAKDTKSSEETDFCILYNELFSRKYRHSLFKSYSEFDLFFKNWTDEQCRSLKKKLKQDVCKDQISDYGTFADDKEALEKIGFKDLLWIDSDPNLKKIDLTNVFFVFPTEIVNLRKLPISSKWEDLPTADKYFYLYFRETDTYIKGKSETNLIQFFENKYKDVFKDNH